MFRRHPLLALFTIAYLVFVGFMTLGPQPLGASSEGLLWRALDVLASHSATSWITYSAVEFTANILMFVPIGLFLLLLFGRRFWWLAILVGFTLTVGIETTQLYIPGRVSDIRDIISNTTGAVAGVMAGLVLTAGKARRIKRTRISGIQPAR